MKEYFIRLFEYDRFANQTIVKAIRSANNPVKAVHLMSHLLAAQLIWLLRCEDIKPDIPIELWPGDDEVNFEKIVNYNSGFWLSYVKILSADDFDKEIAYQNTKGTPYQSKLSDILAHVINHGTHHRAQIGQQLKFTGEENLPNTDYIFYIRN
jgi:uncharacterized damage-inducible protein DinB